MSRYGRHLVQPPIQYMRQVKSEMSAKVYQRLAACWGQERTQLVFCVVGVMGSLLVYGVLQV